MSGRVMSGVSGGVELELRGVLLTGTQSSAEDGPGSGTMSGADEGPGNG